MKRQLMLLGLIVACYLVSPLDAKKREKKTLLQESKRAGPGLDVGGLNEVADGGDDEKRCWLFSYGRGAGRPLSQCPGNTQQNGAICYPPCNAGYTGNAFVCWQNCPAGFTDAGATCIKPASYGRGGGYWIGGYQQCVNDNSATGCEQWGAMFYPKCRAGFNAAGCCVCSPNCINGMADGGLFCTKGSYTRGSGVPMTCKSTEQADVGLCYDFCKAPYKGIGPLCWGSCPAGYNQCGALCLEESECTSYLLNFLSPITEMITSAVEEDPVGVFDGLVDIVKDLVYPICAH